MKTIFTTTLLFFLFTIISFGQNRKDADITKVKIDSEKVNRSEVYDSNYSRKIENTIVLSKDTLNIQLETKTEKNSGFDTEKNMPWIGAIIIGFLTVLANYFINKQIRQTNAENIDKQLKSSKELNQLDFNKTVLSANRQMWINDLRDNISKVLSKTLSLSLQNVVAHDEFQELIFLITKTELMLNPEKDIEFIEALKALELCFLEIKSGTKKFSTIEPHTSSVKAFAKKTLKTEWERVKKGE